ncbi:MAG: hypothetical protein EOM67_09075 [Spirochaetia bacterium]|nr:hypothetical protein [Spirochaetia bacterium]
MKQVLLIIFIFLVLATGLSYAEPGWYNIAWQPNNNWLNDSSQQLGWNGISDKHMAHFGVQYSEAISPPNGKIFDRYLTMVVESEPQLNEYRITKIGDINKYFRSFITHSKVNNLEIDSPAAVDYIPIYINNWQYWGGNFKFNTRSNGEIFPNDQGFNGIYTTYYRFRLYPTAHLFDENYILLDETLNFNLKYWGAGAWIATALEAIPYVTTVNVINLQQTGGELTVGSVAFFSDDRGNNSSYTLQITPGEVGSTQFAFHKTGGGATIPYKVRIVNSTLPSSSSFLERIVTTRDMNNYHHDFIELAILGFTPNITFDSGSYESKIKITLTSN